MKLKPVDKIWNYVILFVLLLMCFVMLYPFWNSMVIAFNDGKDTVAGGITFWPRKFTLENVLFVMNDPRIINSFMITVAKTVAGTGFSILVTSLMAFALSKKELAFRKLYMTLSVITMYFGGGLIPSYILIKSLGLRDNFLVYVIPVALSVWNVIIFRSFFISLPPSLQESAKIDGASYYAIFFKIIVPVSLPVFATMTMFTAVGQWNSWFDAALYVSNPNLMPIQNLLRTILNSNSLSELLSKIGGTAANALRKSQVTTRALTMATMVVATIPILIVYPFAQKYFVQGIMIGSLKE